MAARRDDRSRDAAPADKTDSGDIPGMPRVRSMRSMQSMQGSLSRRAFLRRAAAFGAASPLVAGLLAACGSSPSSPTSATSNSGASQSTATSSGQTATSTTSTASGGTPSTQASPSAAAGATSFKVEPAKNKGGKVIFGTFADAQTANPVLSSDTSSGQIIALMFNGVMRTDPSTTNPIGDLAKSWNISSDGITYSFVLQDGIKFHDGQPMTANDVKFTYDLMMNKDTKSPRYSTLTERIDSIDVADDTHISFKLKKPNSAFLVSNMGTGILPQHILKDVQPSALAQDTFSTGKKGRTIGTGPFMFNEWIKDDHVTLDKNPNYWEGSPNLDQWIYKVVPNQTIEVQQLKTGEIDYAGIQPSDVADMQKQNNVNVSIYDTFSFLFYSYQLDATKTTLFQDKAVRQALLYALDRKGIVEAVDFGYSTVAVGTMPVLSWAYNPDGITNKYPYDENKAKSLLDGAGWKPGSDGIRAKNGQRLSFEIWTNSGNQVREQYVTIFQQQWKKIGVDCTPKTQEWNAFLNRIEQTKDFQMFLVGFAWGVDPDQTTMWGCSSYTGGFNMGKYCNPQVDKLLADGLATTDHAKRKQIYTDMQNILMEDLPNVITDFPKSIAGLNKRVHNLFPNAVSTSFNAHQWWVDAG